MTFRAMLAVFGAASAALALPATAATIDTSGAYAGRIGDFGAGFTPAYGQTFTVGTANALNAFTLYLGGGAANVRAYVYSWGGYGAIGRAYYTSDVRSFAGTAGDAFQALSFQVGALDLIAGQRYVMLLSTAGIEQPRNATAAWMPTAGAFGSNPYAGGDFVYSNDGSSVAALAGRRWDASAGALGDVQFKADFSVGATGGAGVPEPATWAMLICGIGLAGGMLRRRRSRAAARLA